MVVKVLPAGESRGPDCIILQFLWHCYALLSGYKYGKGIHGLARRDLVPDLWVSDRILSEEFEKSLIQEEAAGWHYLLDVSQKLKRGRRQELRYSILSR